MEGPSITRVPRTELDHPVELRTNGTAVRIEHFLGNISIRGLFVPGQDLPVGTPVDVKISGPGLFEAAGVVRHHTTRNGHGSRNNGIGIEFTDFHNGNRQRLDDLIEELTLRGLPAS
jgi:PilZ domain